MPPEEEIFKKELGFEIGEVRAQPRKKFDFEEFIARLLKEKEAEKEKKEEQSLPLKETTEEKKEKGSVEEIGVMVDERIRDIEVHRTEITDVHDYDIVTLYVYNGLDKTIQVQLKGNKIASYINPVNVGDPFTVPPNSSVAKNLSIYTAVWLPYSFCEVKALEVPTSGAVTIKYIKRIP